MGIAHGGAPAHGPQPHLRLGARAQDRRPRPPGPLPPSADTLKLGPGLLGIPSMERLGAWGLGVGFRQRARRVKPFSLPRQPGSGQHPLAP